MEERAFIDRNRMPTDQGIREALGKAGMYYFDLDGMSEGCTKEWKYNNRRYGWTLKVSRRKKPLYWTFVLYKHFVLGFHLKPEERTEALGIDLQEATRRAIEGAREFDEGFAIELTIRDEAGYREAKALLAMLLEKRP